MQYNELQPYKYPYCLRFIVIVSYQAILSTSNCVTSLAVGRSFDYSSVNEATVKYTRT